MKQFPLPAANRLKLRDQIDQLFATGHSVKVYPIRCTYRRAEHSAVMVSVPKKMFRHAVDRNFLKRRMREAYRLNSSMVAGMNLHLAFHYIASERLSYSEIEKAIQEIIARLAAQPIIVNSDEVDA
ncbi:MAG: ribonuclease P protein component [Mucinivorans sp.]